VSTQVERNLPNVVTSERAITSLARRLGADSLKQKRQRELLDQLTTEIESDLELIETKSKSCSDDVKRAAVHLFEVCTDLFNQGGEPAIKPDLELLQAIANSLKRTA